jgi:hypothetical protein
MKRRWPSLNMSPSSTPNWKQLIERAASDAEFASPASAGQLTAIEQSLGVQLPPALRELLLESDGVRAHYGAGVIWPSSMIQQQNLLFRTNEDFKPLYMPFDNLLFFGNDGGGDHFAYVIHADRQIHKDDIFRWKHESDSRVWLVNNLEIFFERKAFK